MNLPSSGIAEDLEVDNQALLNTLSWISGITYAILFGTSLTFQVFINYRNQSTKGFSTDYALTGCIGFFFLLLNQTIGNIDPTTDAGRVHPMDILFAKLAFFSSTCAYTQTLIYPSHGCLGSTKITLFIVLSVFFTAALLETRFGIPLKSYCFISLIDLAAFIKAGSSLVKYVFQIRENWVNRSTEGVSKAAFWSDFLGGTFCFIQLQLDAMIAGYSNLFLDTQLNHAKILIALFGMINTSIILVQIHCVYTGSPRNRLVHEDSDTDNFMKVDAETQTAIIDMTGKTVSENSRLVFHSFSDDFLLHRSRNNKRPLLSEGQRSSSVTTRISTTTSIQQDEQSSLKESYLSP